VDYADAAGSMTRTGSTMALRPANWSRRLKLVSRLVVQQALVPPLLLEDELPGEEHGARELLRHLDAQLLRLRDRLRPHGHPVVEMW
jgi:hypothetical protein